jgi:exopolysaccharide biosynthesis polyprenyl glycosylphosphotransferase
VYHRSNAVARWLVLSSDEAFKQVSEQTRAVSPESKFSWLGLDSTSEDMLNWVRENAKQSGIIYESRLRQNSEAMNTLRKIAPGNMTILSLTEYYEHFLLKLPVDSLENDWLGRSIGYNLLHDQVGIRLKRLIDLVFACTAFVITAPLMLLLACIIRVTSRGSVIYRQDRVGLHGTVFTLYKFRSMVEDAEKLGPQWSDVDDPRITRFGKFLRATRLDELPQLWNLIVGNMSLIGPRPERPEFVNDLKKQIPFYEMRELVPPGVTGWAQVMHSYGSSVDDARRKLEYDLYYINNHSIRLDITIVIKTLLVVVTGVGR